MITDDIDRHILLIANYLAYIGEEEIAAIYVKAGFELDEISLLLIAARIIYNDRKNATPVNPLFKRDY